MNFFTLSQTFPPKDPAEIKLKVGRSQLEGRQWADGLPNKGVT